MKNAKRHNEKRCRLQRGRPTLGVIVLLAAVFGAAASRAEDASEPSRLPLSAPVMLLSAPAPQPASEMPAAGVGAPPRPQPTLPSGKLPQYDLSDSAAESTASTDGESIWLQLQAPERPLLIEATIQIDGRHFREARRKRIRRILKELGEASPPEKKQETQTAPETPDGAENTGDETESETITREFLPATSVVEQVRRYAAATGREPSEDEIGWVLSQRIDGPPLLLIRQPFQAFRADQKPAFTILDRDRDGRLSKSEIDGCVESIRECDLNRDDIVDALEISKVAADPRLKKGHAEGPLKMLARVSGPSATDSKPDLKLIVSFDTKSPEKSAITLVEVSRDSGEEAPLRASVRRDTVVLTLSDCILEFSAVQSAVGDQVSVGAVNDGYPLLPALDLYDDGRFTIRELRTIAARLRAFDGDGDGTITLNEIKPTIRLCFGLGPVVHSALAGIRSVQSQPPQASQAAPEWFVRMDRNKDNDLTRGEFPGTDEQFAGLDADKDELISAAEANQFDAGKRPKTESNPGPDPGTAKSSTSNSTRNEPQ